MHDYPVPALNPDTKPFWDAAREKRLLLKQCGACRHVWYLPRSLCPKCWSADTRWIESSGRGTVYSFTIMRRAPTPAFAPRIPYAVALVDLAEGARMMANVVGEGALEVQVGEPVEVCFEERADGFMLPQVARASA